MWENIPKDIFNLICIDLSVEMFPTLELVCKRYQILVGDIYREQYKTLSDKVVDNPKKELIIFNRAKDKLYVAADRGYEKVFDNIDRKTYNKYRSEEQQALTNAMQRAAYRGNLEIIKKTYNPESRDFGDALNTAARHGHGDLVYYMVSKHHWNYRLFILSQCFDQLHILEWLLQIRAEIPNGVWKQALLQGKTSALDLLEKYYFSYGLSYGWNPNELDFFYIIHNYAYYSGIEPTIKLDEATIDWVIKRQRDYVYSYVIKHLVCVKNTQLIDYLSSRATPEEKLFILSLRHKQFIWLK